MLLRTSSQIKKDKECPLPKDWPFWVFWKGKLVGLVSTEDEAEALLESCKEKEND